MSQYFTIRKNGINVFSFSRNSKEYEALYNKVSYPGDWKPLDIEVVERAISYLKEDMRDKLDRINDLYEALKYFKTDAQVIEALSTIKDIKDEVEEINASIYVLGVIEDTYYIFPFDENDNSGAVIEYYIG